MRGNGCHQIGGAAVVQEKYSLSEAPERRGSKLIAARTALRDIVRKTRSHVVNLEI